MRFDRGEERGIGFRIMKGFPFGADHTDRFQRQQHGDGRGVGIHFFGDDFPELCALFR